ncbi:alpha-D-ribose 1-methylphosphonate 5-triphosphate diphosphatase [uncultured Cohaesibacter sp.]|uniref:alpha-D-ribose 1-methylphosphonate 5-triphosphate diphosphatase n=1 Tax=uncultured Cohaesibacter sp. TaxID=1002546 RepID=UPI0029C83FE0|nr:alpha-D-ribose 1-methylphosphonate 5-triphosphate diphosphatase [uncultured Cohaesibacter sp.]
MREFTITGAEVYLPDQIAKTSVTVSDGVIAEIGGAVRGDEIDGQGRILAPALVDVHGDAFERQLMPRPNVFFPMEGAILETDRQLAANGIATAYHALSISWEPGLRSVDRARELIEAVGKWSSRLTVENRIQLRWETFCLEGIPLLEEALEGPLMPSLAFNDHTSMAMLHPDMPMQKRPFEHSLQFPVVDMQHPNFRSKLAGRAERSGLTPVEYASLLEERWQMRSRVKEAIAQVGQMGRRNNVPMLSHDDTQDETRDFYRRHGAAICEFPMAVSVAAVAQERGDMVVFGAPNAVRGGSHLGDSPNAGDMVEAGLCNILASDYYYPAMLAAIARLDADKRADRLKLWKLISTNPARAMKLDDRGEIKIGKRADLVLVGWPRGHVPAIRHTWVAGRTAYCATPAG